MNNLVLENKSWLDMNHLFGISYIDEKVEGTPLFHGHEFIEISYVKSGNGFHYLNGSINKVQKGDMFIINTNMVHRFFCAYDKDELITYNVMFLPIFIEELLYNIDFNKSLDGYIIKNYLLNISTYNKLRFIDINQNKIENIISNIYTEYKAKEPGYITIIKAYLVILFSEIARCITNKNNEIFNKQNNVRNDIVFEIIKNIDTNYYNKFDLTEISRSVHYSKGHICNLFKKEMGTTLTEYINDIRIRTACSILNTNKKIKLIDLSKNIGFNDYKSFFNAFVSTTGLSPFKYKEKCINAK